MTGWGLVVLLAVALLGWALLTANPTTVYILHGDSWRRPRRIGINDSDDFTRLHFTHCTNRGCWSRLCRYSHGQDVGSRSWRWANEVQWDRTPKLWLGPLTLRRRHRVLYFTVPWRGLALLLERALIRHYHPPFNAQGNRAEHRHPSMKRGAA